uniref:Uncharacterized protein n=1 Tax=Romanomermis culicivorax TaxID=13658 RepID=A0A915IVW6_ROMCU
MIYLLRGCGRSIGSIAPEASLWVDAAAEVVLVVVVGRRRIYWAAALNFADGNQSKVCCHDSGPVIGPYCGHSQNGN